MIVATALQACGLCGHPGSMHVRSGCRGVDEHLGARCTCSLDHDRDGVTPFNERRGNAGRTSNAAAWLMSSTS